jgi:hypothetical protein
MNKTIISLILVFALGAVASESVFAVGNADLKADAPAHYTVKKGDTLWDISGRFLNQPWRWPELWQMNRAQIKNPDLIYPGDELVLERTANGPRLSVHRAGRASVTSARRSTRGETLRLSPQIRASAEQQPIPAIPAAAIEPFLSKPLVIEKGALDSAPRIVATQENRVVVGAGNVAYASGITQSEGVNWQVFRKGDELVDPDTHETLGYEAIYLGEARVKAFGKGNSNVTTLEITKSVQEMDVGDHLIPARKTVPPVSYVPHAPDQPVKGRIIAAYDDQLYEVGPHAIVVLDKGRRDGLSVGDVLAILRSGHTAGHNTFRGSFYHNYAMDATRDSPVFSQREAEIPNVKLPDERYGLLMVFRVFDKASYALVMKASRPVNVLDVVTNP